MLTCFVSAKNQTFFRKANNKIDTAFTYEVVLLTNFIPLQIQNVMKLIPENY